MSDFTAVDKAAMSEGISDLSNAHTRLKDLLDSLESELNSSLAKWDGAAREAYRTAKHEWDQAARHMQSVVDKMKVVLTQIADNYDSNERAIQQSWS